MSCPTPHLGTSEIRMLVPMDNADLWLFGLVTLWILASVCERGTYHVAHTGFKLLVLSHFLYSPSILGL